MLCGVLRWVVGLTEMLGRRFRATLHRELSALIIFFGCSKDQDSIKLQLELQEVGRYLGTFVIFVNFFGEHFKF